MDSYEFCCILAAMSSASRVVLEPHSAAAAAMASDAAGAGSGDSGCGWGDYCEELLELSQQDSEAQDEADQLREQSDSDSDSPTIPVARSPQSSDPLHIHVLKAITSNMIAGGVAREKPLTIVSGCSAACAEARACQDCSCSEIHI
jgi:hypothetical protein